MISKFQKSVVNQRNKMTYEFLILFFSEQEWVFCWYSDFLNAVQNVNQVYPFRNMTLFRYY